LTGPEDVISLAYRCPNPKCGGVNQWHISTAAERLHLKHRRYGRDVVVAIGYRRFWCHQTVAEIHQWLSQDLGLPISERHVLDMVGDFLALLRAAQASKIRTTLQGRDGLIIGLDAMQPEQGNTCLYIVREVQVGLTLLAEQLEDSTNPTLSTRLLEPLKALADELKLTWQGVVSDAQESIRLAVAQSLPKVPHQTCHFHMLRDAGSLTFEADRHMKKRLKTAFRYHLARVEERIESLLPTDAYRPVLADYADAVRVTLLEGGVAPFGLGGLRVFDALTDVAHSLAECQKRGGITSYRVC